VTAYLNTSAGRVAYQDEGEGTPVVLLHATQHDHHDFDLIAPTLAQRHRVIAIDWPDHGDSETPAELHPQRLADVLAEFVAALDLPPAVFIGNSVGGYAATRLAITAPDRVAGLVLVNAGGLNPFDPFSRTFTWLLGHRRVARVVLPRLVPGYMKARTDNDRRVRDHAVARAKTSAGSSVGAAMWRGFLRPDFDLRADAGRVTQPALLVWGSRDVVLPVRAGRAALAALPNARLEVLRTGHVVFSSAPAEFLALVQPFLARVFADQPTT
jgi:pimeloyl-ACP methyl ester carboxylesterase